MGWVCAEMIIFIGDIRTRYIAEIGRIPTRVTVYRIAQIWGGQRRDQANWRRRQLYRRFGPGILLTPELPGLSK